MARRPELTPRQRQSQRIMRERAARKKHKERMQKVTLIGGGVLCAVLLVGGVWGWKSGFLGRKWDAGVNGFYAMTVKAGFSVQTLYLEGRNRTSMEDIDKALDVKKGDPIFQLSIGELRGRLEKIESVKRAAVERSLPGTLYVRIVEREPVAQWQHEGKIALVDDNGVIMNGLDRTPYQNLPLIVGDEAPKHVAELLTLLALEPDLARRFSAAIYVGERRWNIRLSAEGGPIEVKLPENDPAAAWKKLARMQADKQVLDRDVKVIDLRLEDRMFIKLSPAGASGKSAGAKDT